MKKIFSIICAAAMAVSVAGCSKKSDSSDTSSEQKKASPTAYVPKISKIEKRVIWETENIRVSSEYFKRVETGLKIKIENKSSFDLDLDVKYASFSVNDLAMTALLFCDVPAGETLYDTIEFNSDVLSEGEIREIGKAEFILTASYDDSSIKKEVSDKIVVESDSDSWKEPKIPDGQLIYDADGIKMIDRGIVYYPFPYYRNILPIYIENNTGQEISADLTWAKVNGDNVSLREQCYIPDGKRAILRINIDDIMKESGADDLKSLKINFDIEIGDNDPFRTEYLLIKDVSGYEKPTEKTTENKEEG